MSATGTSDSFAPLESSPQQNRLAQKLRIRRPFAPDPHPAHPQMSRTLRCQANFQRLKFARLANNQRSTSRKLATKIPAGINSGRFASLFVRGFPNNCPSQAPATALVPSNTLVDQTSAPKPRQIRARPAPGIRAGLCSIKATRGNSNFSDSRIIRTRIAGNWEPKFLPDYFRGFRFFRPPFVRFLFRNCRPRARPIALARARMTYRRSLASDHPECHDSPSEFF